ncbi:MgtC/SapB family protein [Roseitranquillus sediminis]|uniref:MgtC/SapB family protein n=1 Tax=Roseitranquillus sediminis TaxID=2809051 RepID=UPI001D0CAED8|nr:MgtC/SapB family protein [Roseitranquillus sediminis]MBM9594664.1 MgtC/SapB family protein [Roseitranquillus sediminis]
MFDEFITDFGDPFAAVSWQVASMRMLFALLLGGIIGWEREVATKPAGLRTHMLVSLAACIFTLLTFELMQLEVAGGSDAMRTDPIRLIEAITSGVAFLAAGMIFTDHDKVRGLTTGAGLWLGGAIGVACGLGQLMLASLATGVALIVLWLMRLLLARLTSQKEPR